MPSFTVWDFYFATVVGMCLHPGHRVLDLENCAVLADKMLQLRESRKEVCDALVG